MKYNDILKESADNILLSSETYLIESSSKDRSLITSIRIITALSSVLLFYFNFIRNSKYDKQLSDKINNIINEKNKFKVNIIKDKEWNSYAILNFNTIYITSGLYEALNENERVAVLLHEAKHVKDMHKVKQEVVDWVIPSIGSILFKRVLDLKAKNKENDSSIKKFIWILPASFIVWLYLFAKPLYSRHHEYIGDKFSSSMGYGKYLLSAIHKIEQNHKQKEKESPTISFIMKFFEFFSSDAKYKNRIDKILSYEENKNLSFDDIKIKVSKEIKN